jgi:hypothetical protein
MSDMARHLKRSVERFLIAPLSNLVASEQVRLGDLIYIDLHPETGKFTFSKRCSSALFADSAELAAASEMDESPYSGSGIPLPQMQAVSMFGSWMRELKAKQGMTILVEAIDREEKITNQE